MAESETTSIEVAAGEQLGVHRWDRPGIFEDSAETATDNGLPYWIVIVLSGAIATLGLAVNSSAVVIGAMLVAPLLAPVVGLALSLAVGDGRLAVQTAAVVLGSTIAVVVVGAALTALLPFQTITLEISARTRPTTLDLVIAIFSGLVGAVVTVARGSRLSAAIPGVAISVALIPPLAVAGFGIGVGWNAELIKGSLLLYGANLAGIVLSGMTVFLLVGMHRSDVLQTAREWHDAAEPHGVVAWADRARWVRSLGVFRSAWARVGLVLAFAVALGFPLSETLAQIARETRVERAVSDTTEALFDLRDRSSVLSRQVVYGPDRTQVYLRVATTEWFAAGATEEFERLASARAGEPVGLALVQVPTRGEDLAQLASLLPGREASSPGAPVSSAPIGLGELLASARAELRGAIEALALPDRLQVVGFELGTDEAGNALLTASYLADEPLPPDAEQMVRKQLARDLDLPGLRTGLEFLDAAPRELAGEPADSVRLRPIADALRRRATLAAELLAPDSAAREHAEDARAWLVARGVGPDRVVIRAATGSGLRARIVATPRSEIDEPARSAP